MGILARRPESRPITEAEAYARCHGDSGPDRVRLTVMLRPRPREAVTGETLRRAFATRLERHPRR
jgi:hypothetical protein